MQPFRGYMIPGLYFESDYCLYVLRWEETPTQIKKMTQIWVITPDNKKICYIDPVEGIPVFNKYHLFDEVTGAQINIQEDRNYIKIRCRTSNEEILSADIQPEVTLENRIVNLLLNIKYTKKLLITNGKTETGKAFSNEPVRIVTIADAKVIFHGMSQGKLIKPKRKIRIGDGEISEKALINYCIHHLEE